MSVQPTTPRQALTTEEVCSRLRGVIGRHSIRRFVLFGSFARGTQTVESDVDVIVIGDFHERFLDRYLPILPMLHELLRPHAVEPLIYTEAEHERMLARLGGVVVTAAQEGIEIHVDGTSPV